MNGKRRTKQVVTVIVTGLLVLTGAASLGGCNLFKPKTKKAFNEACSMDTDCESLDCVGQGNFCTKACTYNNECGGDLVCRQKDDGQGDHCAKPVGQPANGTCMDPYDCASGHCLKKVGEDSLPGFCSFYCKGPEDCPDGMKLCDAISDTGNLKMCLPGNPGTPPPKIGVAPRKTTPKAPVTTPTTPTPPVSAAGTGTPARPSLVIAPLDAGAQPADAGAQAATKPDASAPSITLKPGPGPIIKPRK